MSYETFIAALASFTSIHVDAIENLLGTFLVVGMYFVFKTMLTRLARSSLASDLQDQFASDVVPRTLRLVAMGFLFKIWLTGEASFASFFKISPPLMGKVVSTIYIYLFYLGAKITTGILLEIKHSEDDAKLYTLRRTTNIIFGFICITFLGRTWIVTSGDLSTYLGLLSAGIAIALQDVITSLAGWFYLLFVKPFDVGDRVQIGEHKGDVIDVKLLQFALLETGNWVDADQPTGRVLTFPNSYVFKNVVANYHGGFQHIFSEIPVMITFESDWKKTSTILHEILNSVLGKENFEAVKQIRRASRKLRLSFFHLDNRIITSVADSGVILTMRFLCQVRERRFLEARIWEKILEAFAKHDDIDLAYPTTRFYQTPSLEQQNHHRSSHIPQSTL